MKNEGKDEEISTNGRRVEETWKISDVDPRNENATLVDGSIIGIMYRWKEQSLTIPRESGDLIWHRSLYKDHRLVSLESTASLRPLCIYLFA